jgi:glucose-6-phosphate isomerase
MPSLTHSPAWQALIAHHARIKDLYLRTLFADDPGRAERLSAEGGGLFLDYSKNRITEKTLQLLLALAAERGVAERRRAMSPERRSTRLNGVPCCMSRCVRRAAPT